MDEIAAAEVTRIRQVLKAHMPALRETYHVASLSLFGAYVRGEQQPGSDLGILVTFDEMPSLLAFVDLKLTLSDLLGVEVDLVMRSALKPHIGERILDEAVPV